MLAQGRNSKLKSIDAEVVKLDGLWKALRQVRRTTRASYETTMRVATLYDTLDVVNVIPLQTLAAISMRVAF